jgi:hypothetical protein
MTLWLVSDLGEALRQIRLEEETRRQRVPDNNEGETLGDDD